AQDDLLAPQAGRRRDAHVEVVVPAVVAEGDATVERERALVDVEPGHHLDPGDDLPPGLHALHLAEQAVHADADLQHVALPGLEVDVARPALVRRLDPLVDELLDVHAGSITGRNGNGADRPCPRTYPGRD